ncbi:MAG TPA: porin [Micropepsaceae bacterium]|nr:porin [Micropepsaceae bacterium]
MQIGGSGSVITNLTGNAAAGGPRTITLQDRPEVRVDGNRLVSTGAINARGGSMWGLETASNFMNFYLAAEYMHFGVDRDVNCTGCTIAGGNPGNPEFSGWYVEASWLITGETKTYQAIATNNEMGTFNNPRVITPFSWDGRTWGAWELAARYSDLDLNWHAGAVGTTCTGILLGCVRGGEEKIWTVGVNWYLNNNILMRFNYLIVDVNKLNTAGQQIGQNFDVLAIRLQYSN